MENKEPDHPSAQQNATPDKSATTMDSGAAGLSTPESNNEEAALAEFRRKHPDLAAAPGNILQRKLRLERGHKYFDSGDYNMAKAKAKKETVVKEQQEDGGIGDPKLTEELEEMGDDHPTPDSIPHKKYPPAPGVSKLALWERKEEEKRRNFHAVFFLFFSSFIRSFCFLRSRDILLSLLLSFCMCVLDCMV